MKYRVHTKCDRPYLSWRMTARQAAETALTAARRPPGDMTVVLTSDEAVRSLSRRFTGVDRATDVLSFPSGEHDPDTGRKYLGDVVVSVPMALRQARRARKPAVEEIQLLVIHGVLHLLGFDHGTVEKRKPMWALQRATLARLRRTPGKSREIR